MEFGKQRHHVSIGKYAAANFDRLGDTFKHHFTKSLILVEKKVSLQQSRTKKSHIFTQNRVHNFKYIDTELETR